jgi:drug/metabolite transporter, DME family
MAAPAQLRPQRGALMVLLAAALWASVGLFGKALYEAGHTPLELASVRAAVGFLALLAWMLARQEPIGVRRRELPLLALYGLGAFALFEYLYFETVQRTTLGVAAALLYTAPAFVVLGARLAGQERIGPVRWVSLGAVLVGVALVTGFPVAGAPSGASLSGAVIALGLGSGVTYGLYTLLSKVAVQRHGERVSVLYALGFAAVAFAGIAPPWQPAMRAPQTLPLLIGLGLVPTLAAFLLYVGALRHLRATTASMLASSEPAIAALLGFVVLGEALFPSQTAGILLLSGAAALLSWRAGHPGPGAGG